MDSVASALRFARQQLHDHSDSAALDAELLLAYVLQKQRSFLYAWPEQVLSAAQQQQFQQLLAQRRQGKPIAHLLGVQEFWSLPFKISSDTLIPRPETELLVSTTLDLLNQYSTVRLLDLGTGSGAIALALAHERPQWHITATDSSAAALRIAKDNAELLELGNTGFIVSDWFEQLDAQTRFDVIISNPPYIDPADVHLQQGDVRFEPRSALVAEQQGLADLYHIIEHSQDYLYSGGWLLLEHGYDQGPQVSQHLHQYDYENIQQKQDLSGHTRISYGQKPG